MEKGPLTFNPPGNPGPKNEGNRNRVNNWAAQRKKHPNYQEDPKKEVQRGRWIEPAISKVIPHKPSPPIPRNSQPKEKILSQPSENEY